MMSSWLLMKVGLPLLGLLAIVGAVLAALAGARNAGRMAERVDQLKKAAQAAQTRTRVETDAAGLSDDELRRRLRAVGR